MLIKERQSNFELLKIIAMLMIVAHHFIAKNAFNVDVAIKGITFNKFFLQFIGNWAFVGNNLFFLCSAWFLVKKEDCMAAFPRQQLTHIWRMERPMLFYSIGLWLLFWGIYGTTVATWGDLGRSVFPMSTGLWWYPTTYAVFLLLHPFYHKGLCALRETELTKLILTMLCVWSVSTLIPFFDYGPSAFLTFVMLYAIVFWIRNFQPKWLEKKSCRIFLAGTLLASCSILVLDILGIKIPEAQRYSCYFIRGNFRFLPMVLSVTLFMLATTWKMQSKLINYIASLTFGIYLLHMYPLMMNYLFSKQGALFDMTSYVYSVWLPLYAVGNILICFVGCALVEAVRKGLSACLGCLYRKIFPLTNP